MLVYDLEMMKQGSGLGERMDEAIKYKVNIGESGNNFAEYWSDKGKAFSINIAGKDVVLRFVGPKNIKL